MNYSLMLLRLSLRHAIKRRLYATDDITITAMPRRDATRRIVVTLYAPSLCAPLP